VNVSSQQRFTKAHPCPVCGGHKDLPRGEGRRCWGFIGDDGAWANCTRPEYAGALDVNQEAGTYAHKLAGECRCGKAHGYEAQRPKPNAGTNGHKREIGEIVNTFDYVDEVESCCFRR
jgi:hypothetical protein